MTAVQQLQAQIDGWRGKLQAAEQEHSNAGLMALDGAEDDAADMLARSSRDAELARQAIAALQARMADAQARDKLAKADELTRQADEIEAKAIAIAAEVDGIIGMARRLGVNLVRRGAPQVDADMRNNAGNMRMEAASLRMAARKLQGAPKNDSTEQVQYQEGWFA